MVLQLAPSPQLLLPPMLKGFGLAIAAFLVSSATASTPAHAQRASCYTDMFGTQRCS